MLWRQQDILYGLIPIRRAHVALVGVCDNLFCAAVRLDDVCLQQDAFASDLLWGHLKLSKACKD
jgi:hypothetical protein